MLITFAIIGAGCCFSVANTHMGSPGHPHTEVLGEDWSSEGFPLSDMLITFAVVVGASCCISVANTYVRGRSHNTDEVLAEDWSSEEQNMDHLVSGGTAHFLDHIDTDLEAFHILEERMNYLKEVLREHAQRNVVGSGKLDNAGFLIHELEEQVMKPFDEHLTALRAELMKPHVKYNEETLLEISNLIRTSEMFLKTAQEKVEIVEVMEEVWEVMEEEEPDLGANNIGRTQKEVFRKKDQKSWDQELQDKLEVVVSDSAAPVAKSEEWGSPGKRKGGDNSQMRKNLKFASDSVQTGALEQNTPIVGDDNLEGKEERGNALSKEIGAGLGAGDMDERLVGENGLHSTGVETVETIGPETYEDSVVKTAFSAAEFLQQKVEEHQKVLVVGRGLPRYIGLAIVVAAVFLVIGIVCIVHRVTRVRRKINFEGMAVDGEGVCAADLPCPDAASTFLKTPTLTTSKSSGYQELSETQRVLESESGLQGWQGVKGAVSDAAAFVTPYGSKVTPRVRKEYKKK